MKPAVPGGKAHAAVGERVDVRGVGGGVSRDTEVAHPEVICGSSRQRAAVSQQQAERTLPGYPSWQHISKRGAWRGKKACGGGASGGGCAPAKSTRMLGLLPASEAASATAAAASASSSGTIRVVSLKS